MKAIKIQSTVKPEKQLTYNEWVKAMQEQKVYISSIVIKEGGKYVKN